MSNNIKNECFINGVQYKCRTCFDPGRTLYSLADECSNTKTWRVLLKEVAQLQTSEDELFPKTVCSKCLDKLISYYDFILQIHNVNKKYSQLLGSCTNLVQNEIISNEINNFTDCLADAAIAIPMENYMTEIKVEDELLVPYDIILSSNNEMNEVSETKLENEDTHDPFIETSYEDTKSISEQLKELESTSVNEVRNQYFDDENYNDFSNESSSQSSNESEYVPQNKLKKLEDNDNSISQTAERKKVPGYDKIEKVNNQFECNICKKTYTLLRNCRRHVEIIHSRNESSSSSSDESDYELPTSQLSAEGEITHKSQDNDHEIEKVNNRFICPICKKSFSLQRNCRRHMNIIHSQPSIFPCGFCDQIFNCRDYLQLHLKRMHSGESLDSNNKHIDRLFGERLYSKPAAWRLVECKLCDIAFNTTKELRQHLAKHIDVATLDVLNMNSNIVQHLFSNIFDLHFVKDTICKDIRERNWFKYYTVLSEYSYEMSISDTEAEDLEEDSADRISKYKCEMCKEEFPYKYQVFSHLKEFHDEVEIPLKCKRCKLKFISIEMYEQHRQTHCRNEHKYLRCAHCPGKFIWPENMKNHNCASKIQATSTDNNIDKLKCNLCDCEFEEKTKYQQHLKTHNIDGTISAKTTIHCGLCDHNFKKLRDLRKHMRLHADGKTGIDFENCIYIKHFEYSKSINQALLQQQIQNAYRKFQISRFYQAIDKYGNELDISDSDSCVEDARKEYMCELCKESFKKRRLLLNHQNERHKYVALPFTCKECKQQFVNFNLLQQHLKRVCWNEHRRIAQQCEYCNARFIWPNNLLKHKEIQHHMFAHVQLYYCLLCPKTFFSLEHLNQHSNRHRLTSADVKTVESIIHSTWWPNGKKTIKCKKCSQMFKSIAELKQHFSSENPQNLCANQQHSLGNYSITNQKGFELHLELDSETEVEDDVETAHNKRQEKSFYPYNCCMCSKSFKRKYHMAQHQRSMHNYELLELKCERCIFKTVSQEVLDYHKTTQCFNTDKQYACNQCNFKFMWQENLDYHIALFHTPKELPKPTDADVNTANSKEAVPAKNSENFVNSALKSTSSKQLPANKVTCPVCNASFFSSNLAVHLMRHRGEKPFKCDLCEMAFPRNADLKEHRRVHTGERPYKCTHCEKSFSRQKTLTIHKRLHTGERPYKCTVCPKTFTKSDLLKIHMLNHTGEKPFACDICGKRFVCADYLRKHRQMLGHDELFSTPGNNISDSNVSKEPKPKEKNKTLCPICGVCLSSKTCLSYHIRGHTGERPYKCHLCDMAFARKDDLRNHLRIHNDDRPFKCTQCDKRFVSQCKLAVHNRVHTGERPYQCTFCQKTFPHSGNFKIHLRIHTGEKPYECDVCGKAFSCGAYLKKHRIAKGHQLEKNRR